MDVRIAIPDENVRGPVLNAGLEAVTLMNQEMIRDGRAPTFDEGIERGVRWKAEPPGAERFDHARRVMQRGWGDCDDLAPWHAATLRETGEDPGARAIVYKSGPHLWHAVTQLSDGSLRDPSQTAGMRTRRGSRAEGIRPAVVASMAAPSVGGDVRPYVAVVRDGRAWTGRTDLPIGKRGRYALAVTHQDVTPAKALAGSMLGACELGGCCGQDEHVEKLYALSGLLRGATPVRVASVVGVDTTKDAIETIAELCPAILDELKAHRRAMEGGARGRPFDFGQGFTDGVSVGFSFGSILHDVGKVVKGATGLIQGVVSLIPGIGTGISAAIGAGMALLEGGSPLDIAVNAAFGAIPIPPGARQLAQVALDAILKLVQTKNIGEAAINAVRSQIPAGFPQQVFDTLAHLVLSHVTGRATTGVVTHPAGQATKIVPLTLAKHFQALHKIAPTVIHPAPQTITLARPVARLAPSRAAVHTRGAWVFAA